jgi:uncharacterized membrane protein HdeD (DUF308 family)
MNPRTPFQKIAYAVSHWWLSVLSGILFIVIGTWVLFTPRESYLALSLIFSITFLVNGAMEVFSAFTMNRETQGWGWILAGGIIDVLIGLMLVSNPGITASLLPFVVGFGLLFRSMMAIGVAFDLKSAGISMWGWLLALGVAGLLFSFLLLRSPAIVGLTIAILTGLAFIAIGVFRVALGMRLKKLHDALAPAS